MKVSIASDVGPDSGPGDNHCQLASKIPPQGSTAQSQGLDQAQTPTCLGCLPNTTTKKDSGLLIQFPQIIHITKVARNTRVWQYISLADRDPLQQWKWSEDPFGFRDMFPLRALS